MSSLISNFAAFLLAAFVAIPAFAQDRYAEFNGVKIRYIDVGKGEPIVLLHGGTSSLESWVRSGVVANLERDFRVIAFDARGAGKSDKPRDPAAYGRQQALDVVRLLDALQIPRAHIVGFSLGGSTVAQLLTLHPERFLTAIQVGAAGRSPESANDPRIEIEAAEIEKGCISRSRLYRQAPPNAKPTEEMYRQREAECRADPDFNQYSTAASLRGYRDQAVTPEQMKMVKVPTLGVVGSLDHALKEMQELKKLRPDMKLIVLEGVSHTGATGIQNQPGLIVALREFIADHARTGGARWYRDPSGRIFPFADMQWWWAVPMTAAGVRQRTDAEPRTCLLWASQPTEGIEMNSDQVKGRVKEVAGKVEKNVGRAVGNPTTEAKGLATEIEGKVQKTAGDIRSDIADAIDKK